MRAAVAVRSATARRPYRPGFSPSRLKLCLAAGRHPEVCWKKRHFTGLVIEVDHGAGWEFLAQDTISHYLDKLPLPKPGAVWK